MDLWTHYSGLRKFWLELRQVPAPSNTVSFLTPSASVILSNAMTGVVSGLVVAMRHVSQVDQHRCCGP